VSRRFDGAACLALAWGLLGSPVGCKDPDPGAAVPRATGDGPLANGTLSDGAASTWTRDVAPLLARRCGACHGDESRPGVTPPGLGSYEEARRAAAAVLLAVRRRVMPPFGADNTGLCGTWLDAPWLTDTEIATVASWVERGSPRGPPLAGRDRPETPVRLDDHADHLVRVDPGVAFAPGLGERAYRCFVVEPAQARDTAIIGLTVTAEPAAAVRQAALYSLDNPRAVRRARALDAADPGPGWGCYGAPAVNGAAGAGAGVKLLASWSRNTPVQRLPADTGVPLPGAARLILQLRYDLVASAPGIPVRARMLLATGKVGHPARLVPVRAAPLALTPGQPQAQARAIWTADRRAMLLGLVPRMHTLGRVLDLERTGGGQRECLAHFGHWDVYDQQLFREAAPVALAPGDRVALSCEFATTSRSSTVTMGEGPDDEQCLAHLYLVDAP
jgi:mono/diheme cytochrome c family protein